MLWGWKHDIQNWSGNGLDIRDLGVWVEYGRRDVLDVRVLCTGLLSISGHIAAHNSVETQRRDVCVWDVYLGY